MPQPRPDRWRPGSVDPTHKTMRRSSQPCDPLPGRVPVRPSDKPLNTQETSKGNRGIIYMETRGINQRGEKILTVRRRFLVPKREA